MALADLGNDSRLDTLDSSQLTDTVKTNDHLVSTLNTEEREFDWLSLDQVLAPGRIDCD